MILRSNRRLDASKYDARVNVRQTRFPCSAVSNTSLRSPQDEQKTKDLLRKNYEHIKHVFKSYAAAIGSGNEIFTMGKNSYYEFLGVCDIIDDEKVKVRRNKLRSDELRYIFSASTFIAVSNDIDIIPRVTRLNRAAVGPRWPSSSCRARQ